MATTTTVNPLVSLLANRASLGSLITTLLRFGSRGVVIAARAYLGPLAPQTNAELARESATKTGVGGFTQPELALLALAVAKLAFEVGELALHNPTVDANGRLPEFVLDDKGRAPALSLAHVVAAARWWEAYNARRDEAATSQAYVRVTPTTTLMTARTARYAESPRYSYTTTTNSGVAMTTSRSRGCSSCGGSVRTATSAYASSKPSTTASTGNRIAGTAGAVARAPSQANCGCGCGGCTGSSSTSSGCGCGCSSGCGCGAAAPTCGCGSGLPVTRTYDSSQCPTFAISCETKTALRDCVKTALCDFMRCLADTLCPDGRFDSNVFNDPDIGKQLVDCVGQLACSFVHCVPDALCGPECEQSPPKDCVPCDYAVEVLQ